MRVPEVGFRQRSFVLCAYMAEGKNEKKKKTKQTNESWDKLLIRFMKLKSRA